MKQILQNLKTGNITVAELPVPSVKPGCLIIETRKSLVSLGTEKMLLDFGRAGWISKAKQHPEKVKQVMNKIKTDGLAVTFKTVINKLDRPIPLGYSNVGVVREVGRNVIGFNKGDRVVSNGPHAEVVCVPQNLCSKIPNGVDDTKASFTVISSVALQGIRLVAPTIGETVAVTGLGLIGLIACQILKANGCNVLGFDIDRQKVQIARDMGIDAYCNFEDADPVEVSLYATDSVGVDAVLITASTKSNEPIEQAPRMCRKRGRVVLVGVTGLQLSRDEFYKKEISFQVSCSYGPGRYEINYEDKNLDYPIGYVRWTEKRNFEAVLGLFEKGSIITEGLVSKVVDFDEARQAYEMVEKEKDILGLVLDYKPDIDLKKRAVNLDINPDKRSSKVVLGVIGAGNFSGAVLLPSFKKTGVRMKTIASSGGMSSNNAGIKNGFEINTTDYKSILEDEEINSVVIATQHNSHAKMVSESLQAGKNVFVEKPLALSSEELEGIRKIYSNLETKPLLMTGFNRRFSPCVDFVRNKLKSRTNPLCCVYTVNAGYIPMDHWAQDIETGGGRIIGEACHFIDLVSCITGSDIVTVYSAKTEGHSESDEDKMTIVLRYKDGSIGVINYFANGSKQYPKEHLEIFSEGKNIVLDNYQKVTSYGFSGNKKLKLKRLDKGHSAEAAAFVEAIEKGHSSPISFENMYKTTLATFAAVESSKSNRPVEIEDFL